jgi:hypothetical protein
VLLILGPVLGTVRTSCSCLLHSVGSSPSHAKSRFFKSVFEVCVCNVFYHLRNLQALVISYCSLYKHLLIVHLKCHSKVNICQSFCGS